MTTLNCRLIELLTPASPACCWGWYLVNSPPLSVVLGCNLLWEDLSKQFITLFRVWWLLLKGMFVPHSALIVQLIYDTFTHADDILSGSVIILLWAWCNERTVYCTLCIPGPVYGAALQSQPCRCQCRENLMWALPPLMPRSWGWGDLELATTGHLVTLTSAGHWPHSATEQSDEFAAQPRHDNLRTPGPHLLGWAFLVTIKGWLAAPVYICPWQWARRAGASEAQEVETAWWSVWACVPVLAGRPTHSAPLLSCSCPVPGITVRLSHVTDMLIMSAVSSLLPIAQWPQVWVSAPGEAVTLWHCDWGWWQEWAQCSVCSDLSWLQEMLLSWL